MASIQLAEDGRDERRGMRGVLRFITAGSVDDGKSTLIGRLLFDSREILEDQMAAVKRASRKRGLAVADLSLLTDGLEAEREQGITIDVAYRYFATARRKFIIADTPGHVQYTRNMATGASTAQAAVILADASKGLLEQGRRHLYIAHLLGIRELVVAVNKMDLVGYARDVFEDVRAAFERFAGRLPGRPPRLRFVPVSALRGDMVVTRGEALDWYGGPTLLEILESIETVDDLESAPLRLPVQLVQRTPARGRTYAGRVASGTIAAGQAIVIAPAGHATTVKALYRGDAAIDVASAGDSITIAFRDELDVARGDLVAAPERPPRIARSFNATLVWLDPEPLKPGGRYFLKHTTRSTRARIALVSHVVDIHTLEHRPPDGPVGANTIVYVGVTSQVPLAVDAYATDRATGAFVLIDELTHRTVAAGMIA